MSNHDFHKTPLRKILSIACAACRIWGRSAEIAVMPQSPQDVLTLLAATLTMKEKYATRPLITMSMGKSGGVSRVTGRLFGSAMTFGTVGQASAPGQIAIAKLREVMDILSDIRMARRSHPGHPLTDLLAVVDNHILNDSSAGESPLSFMVAR